MAPFGRKGSKGSHGHTAAEESAMLPSETHTGNGAVTTTTSKKPSRLNRLLHPRRNKRIPNGLGASVSFPNAAATTSTTAALPAALDNHNHNHNHNQHADLSNLANQFRSNIEIKDRRHKMKTYKQCFTGSDAVDCLLELHAESIRTREEAVQMGQAMMRELHLFEHVLRDHEFKDEHLFYHFLEENETNDAPANEALSSSTGEIDETGATNANTNSTNYDRSNTNNTHNTNTTTDSNNSKNQKIIRMDKYGFLLEDERSSKESTTTLRTTSDALDTMYRIKKWETMLDKAGGGGATAMAALPFSNNAFSNTQTKVKYYARRGLPDTMRSRAWTVLTGVDIIMSEREGEYEEMVARADEKEMERQNKRASMDTASCSMDGGGTSVLETIERDIHRTFPRHYLFHNGLDDDEDDDDNNPCHGKNEELEDEEGIELGLESDDDDDEDTDGNTDTDVYDDLKEDENTSSEENAVTAEAKKQLFNDMIGISNAQMTAQMAKLMVGVQHGISCGGLNSVEGGTLLEAALKDDDKGNDDNMKKSSSEHTSSEYISSDEGNKSGSDTFNASSSNSSSGGGNGGGHGQAALRRVLRAYSVYDGEVGYCQGMNFIAAMFLTFLSEEEAFWLLVVVMNEEPYMLRELFGEDMSGTHEVLYIAEKLISQFLPKLSHHLEAENIHISMFVTQWLLTLYTSTFPFELVSRVWDCFLVEGWKVVYRVMLSLLEFASKDLLDLQFEHILNYFRDYPTKVDGGTIMNGSLKIALKRKHIQKHVNEWRRNAGYEDRPQQSSKMQRRHSANSSASSTLNSLGHGGLPKPSLAVAKGFLKKSPKEIKIEDLSISLIPIVGSAKFAVMLYNVISPDECSDLIDRVEDDGFELAGIYNSRTNETLRNCTRCILDDRLTADNWFERILHALKGTEFEHKVKNAPWMGSSDENKNLQAVSLNERLRVLKYLPGQYFSAHNDTRFIRGPEQGDRAGETSYLSVQVFLNEKFKGGTTRFIGGTRYLDVTPKTGSVLIFDHNIFHEGCKLVKGTKYVVRSDIMYSTKPEGFPSVAGTGLTQEL